MSRSEAKFADEDRVKLTSTLKLPSSPPLSIENINKNVLTMQYALRGPIVLRAQELEKKKQSSPELLPNFAKLLYANVGNPQLTGQRPITFVRQLLATLVWPDRSPPDDVPADVLSRAETWLKAANGSVGCYSQSKGIPLFRTLIADWLTRRDGFAADPESIFLTDGASSGVKMMLELLIQSSADGILVPVPEYPLYTASIVRMGGAVIPYYLDEEHEWRLDIDELTRRVAKARAEGVTPRALVIINPGNPTGALLTAETQVDVIKFCERENLLLVADEVYQDNVYQSSNDNGKTSATENCFVSFRKLIKQLGSPAQLVSLHSASKGLYGECGFRGGMFHLENVSNEVVAVVYKMASVSLCANTIGQAVMAAVVTPPGPSTPSYELYLKETSAIYQALCRKAVMASKYLNSVPGLSCQPIRGALYAYPKLLLPPAAVATARHRNQEPDMLFCLEFLDAYGVVCVPGSGFGQKPGTYHVRLTILPAVEDFEVLLNNFVAFYLRFCRQYETHGGDLSPEKGISSGDASVDASPVPRFEKKHTIATDFSTRSSDAVSTHCWEDNDDTF